MNKQRNFLALFPIFLVIIAFIWGTPARAGNGRGFLWKISSPQGTVHLFGSIHMATPDVYPLDPLIMEVFEKSDALVVEADINAANKADTQKWISTHGRYQDNQDTLENNLSERTKSKAAEVQLNLKPLDAYRPWLVAIMIQAQKLKSLGLDEKYGLDKYFLDRADTINKPVEELESLQYQLQLFEGLSPQNQELFLYYSLMELKMMDEIVPRVIRTWREGNTDEFNKLFFKGYNENPELEPLADKIIYDRNTKMTARIEKYLTTGKTYFVVIGAGHLVGPKGIVNRLKSKGYRVDQAER